MMLMFGLLMVGIITQNKYANADHRHVSTREQFVP